MPSTSRKKQWLMLGLLHLWWLLLSGTYLSKFWRSSSISGVDGSGHVAALHLYAAHVYPHVEGWLPEFFGGMPFPVFYPPLFYWVGATIMRFGGADAISAAKILTIVSFIALPSVLYGLGRRLGLSEVESLFSAALAGVIACGQNLVALFAVGLLGLFEVGLYTQTLGFVWFCLWCGSLPHARHSRAAALLSTLSLTAILLTNVHVLPLSVAYGAAWLSLDTWRTWRGESSNRVPRLLINSFKSILLLTSSLMIAGVWLIPLIGWHSYLLGQPQPPDKLFVGFGMYSILFLPCLLTPVIECRRRPALVALCIALLTSAAISLLPVDRFLSLPFQPWRLISAALLLATIPTTLLIVRLLRTLLPGKYVVPCLAFGLILFSVLQPRPAFNAASLDKHDAEDFTVIRQTMKQLSPGMTVVEILDLNEVFENGDRWSVYEQNASRALAHQLAMDGRQVSWGIFREHAVSAPFSTAIRNLFSTTPEKFGLSGIALAAASSKRVDVDKSLRLARQLNVRYYLVKSPLQVLRLKKNSEVQFLKQLAGWSIFVDAHENALFEEVNSTPVIAWLPARFRDRSENQFEFFNLGEFLAFNGHPEVCVLWGLTPGVNDSSILSGTSKVIAVVDPSEVHSDFKVWFSKLFLASGNVRLLLLSDDSQLSRLLYDHRDAFSSFAQINPSDYPSQKLMNVITDQIIRWQENDSSSKLGSARLWRTNMTYFPAWKTSDQSSVWLTGQGSMAIYDSKIPVLRWDDSHLEIVGIFTSLAGIICSAFSVIWWPNWSKARKRRSNRLNQHIWQQRLLVGTKH